MHHFHSPRTVAVAFQRCLSARRRSRTGSRSSSRTGSRSSGRHLPEGTVAQPQCRTRQPEPARREEPTRRSRAIGTRRQGTHAPYETFLNDDDDYKVFMAQGLNKNQILKPKHKNISRVLGAVPF